MLGLAAEHLAVAPDVFAPGPHADALDRTNAGGLGLLRPGVENLEGVTLEQMEIRHPKPQMPAARIEQRDDAVAECDALGVVHRRIFVIAAAGFRWALAVGLGRPRQIDNAGAIR